MLLAAPLAARVPRGLPWPCRAHCRARLCVVAQVPAPDSPAAEVPKVVVPAAQVADTSADGVPEDLEERGNSAADIAAAISQGVDNSAELDINHLQLQSGPVSTELLEKIDALYAELKLEAVRDVLDESLATEAFKKSGIPSLIRNPRAVTRVADLLVFDAPPPVGFSWCAPAGPAGDGLSCGNWTDERTAEVLLMLLRGALHVVGG